MVTLVNTPKKIFRTVEVTSVRISRLSELNSVVLSVQELQQEHEFVVLTIMFLISESIILTMGTVVTILSMIETMSEKILRLNDAECTSG